MDKHYDGHVWTKTQTTNNTNDVGLAFCSSTCVAHLQSQNPSCDYLQRAHHTSQVNDTEFEGFTKDLFPLFGIVPSGSNIVCKICKQPPKCIVLCEAKIFYVHGKDSSQRAYIHKGTHCPQRCLPLLMIITLWEQPPPFQMTQLSFESRLY